MIERMTKYAFLLWSGDQAAFLEGLRQTGVVDITRSSRPVDEESAAMLSRIEALGKVIARLRAFDLGDDPDLEEIRRVVISPKGDPVQAASDLFSRMETLRNALAAAEKEAVLREAWGTYDPADLKKMEAAGCRIRFYSVRKKSFDRQWEYQVPLQVISQDRDQVRFVTVSDDPDYRFPLEELPAPSGTAEEARQEIAALKGRLRTCKAELLALKGDVGKMIAEKEERVRTLDLYLARASCETAGERTISVFEGFAPVRDKAALEAFLDGQAVCYLTERARPEDNPPIQLRHNRFTRMFAVLTDMYGQPVYNEFDPTPYLSVFFLLFFAMCMGDAGYGILLAIIGLFLKKNEGMKRLAPLVMTLGAGTFVIGIVMHTFFGVDIEPYAPAWLRHVMVSGKIGGFEAPMAMALIVGVIHLCLALIVKTVYATRNRGFRNALGTWGWTLLIVGGFLLAPAALLKLLPAAVLKGLVIGLGLVSATGIFLLNDLHRNPLLNIGSGLWETYNTATGLLGDVLSYLRLYALGLAGGMLGAAFNNIALMTLGEAGLHWSFSLIPFVLIVLVGHALNLAMCCLGAFVHPLRLNFLEFFKNSAYEGRGRKYHPIGK